MSWLELSLSHPQPSTVMLATRFLPRPQPTLYPKPCTLYLIPCTSNLEPQTSNLEPRTSNPGPQTLDPKPCTKVLPHTNQQKQAEFTKFMNKVSTKQILYIFVGFCQDPNLPCTLNLVPCTLYPVPCTLYPRPCTLYPVPYTLYPVPCTLYPVP